MERNQRLVLVAGILGSFVAFLDMAVVNVALPAIRDDLGGGFSSQQWIVDAYLLTLGSMILVAGSLSDLFGRKQVFTAGLIGFAATSLLCAFAPSAPFLIASRGLQGAAGALLVPSSLALIIANFSGPAQGKAIGTWTAWTGIAFVVGPLAGGVLVDAGSWRAVFAINVLPVAATLLVLSRADRDPAGDRSRGQVDAAGAALCVAGLGGIIFALIEAPVRGWNDPILVGALGAGIAAFVAFVVRERLARHPMLDLALFRSRNFAVGNVATLVIYAGLSAATFLITVFLQQVARYSALRAGLALVPVTAMMFVLSPVFGRLSGKFGPRLFMTFGPAVAAAGFVLMTRLDARGDYVGGLLPGVLVFGLGLSSTVAPLTAATLGDIDPRRAGVGSAANNAIARVAGLLAVAGLGAVLSARFSGAIDQHLAQRPLTGPAAAFLEDARRRPLETTVPKPLAAEEATLRPILDDASVRAFRAALWAIAGLLLAGGTISAIGIKNPPHTR
jgi:EmrB/QacA subfamily drug resistance transporter